MKIRTANFLAIFALLAFACFNPVLAQGPNGSAKANSKMIYHNGPVLTGTRNIYTIFYGCWTENCGTLGDLATMNILTDFMISIGNSPYIQINSTYPNASGEAPTGFLIFGGSVIDSAYTHGVELTRDDVVAIISDQVNNFRLPQDRDGIYVIFTSADVSANSIGFCSSYGPPLHDVGIVNGDYVVFGFIGNANRCPTIAAPQFMGPGGTRLPTPNNNFAADAAVTNFAHMLNATLTNPWGNGWYDRYGFENADKCTGTFGQTYTTANGARANINRGGHDYLIEQNWLNDRKGRCAMSPGL